MEKHVGSTAEICSEPVGSGQLWVLLPSTMDARTGLAGQEPGGGECSYQVLTPEHRRALREQFKRGELERLTFQAVTFRAAYPNANYLRFRDEDLAEFAASFVGAPFLRDHNTRQIDARAGTVSRSLLDNQANAFLQTVELTVPRDIEAFLNGQIDRFSISWNWSEIRCSVCGQDWLSAECAHWPGRRYRVNGEERLCELVFLKPRGREVSAVNAPAVEGTGVREVLARLKGLGREGSPLEHEDTKASKTTKHEESEGVDRDRREAGEGHETLLLEAEQRTEMEGGMQSHRDATRGSGESETACVPTVERKEEQVEAGQEARTPDGAGEEAALGDAQSRAAELLEAQRLAVLDARLVASGLPGELHDMVRAALPANWRVRDVDGAIGMAQAAWARLEEGRTVRGMAPRPGHPAGSGAGVRVSGMMDSLDQVQLAFEGLLAGRHPERGVRPLSGIREFYMLMSGDYEMRGMFRPENVGLAAVDSSTMAGLVANALNKVIINQFQAFPRWWEPLVTVEDFATLQQIRYVTIGGVGELPTVAEGASYTEMTWDDQTETADWVKRGGYLGLTLEAIDKDDTRRIQQAGPALARAAWLSLGKAVSGIFTSNAGVGPTMSDGNALFHANHGNLGTSALSYTSFAATRLAMRKQTELNSGERLGGLVVPRYLLVPPDLEATAVQVMASEQMPGTANNDENIYSEGNTHEARLAAARKRVIVVDFWTDASDWAMAADPQLYPSIGLGFRFGREPEIFSVASPSSGLMFTNDTLPIKVRFFFAVGPTDWRGLYKHNVA